MKPSMIVSKMLVVMICFAPALGVAALDDIAQLTPFTQEHPAVIIYLFSGAFVLIGFFLLRTLHQNDKRHNDAMVNSDKDRAKFEKVNERQWVAITKVTGDLKELRGSHDTIMREHHHARGTNGDDDVDHTHCRAGDNDS